MSTNKVYRTRLTFLLAEEVTPGLFAEKVAAACASGALRPGEGVTCPEMEAVGMAWFIDKPAQYAKMPISWPKPAKREFAKLDDRSMDNLKRALDSIQDINQLKLIYSVVGSKIKSIGGHINKVKRAKAKGFIK